MRPSAGSLGRVGLDRSATLPGDQSKDRSAVGTDGFRCIIQRNKNARMTVPQRAIRCRTVHGQLVRRDLDKHLRIGLLHSDGIHSGSAVTDSVLD